MPRPTRTGIRGLYVDDDGRRRIDLRYTDRDGNPQRYSERFPIGTPARAAEVRARDVLAAAIMGTLAKPGTEAPARLAKAFDEYRRVCGTGSPTQKERHCKELLAAFGDVPLPEVNELAIERFKKTRGAKVGPATVNRELQTLRHFLNCAVEWKWLDVRPKVRLLKEPPGRVRWLTDAERDRLYPELPVRFKRVVLAAALSGQRLSNVIGLTRDRVDLKHHTLSIPKTKSGKRHDLDISFPLAAVLREAIADGDTLTEAKGLDAPAHVFLSRHGLPYTSSGVTSFFRKVCARAKVKDFRFHDLRHDFATRARRAGHGLDVVQDLLGHSSPAMTARYAHIGVSELRAAVDAVGEGWNVATAVPRVSKKKAKKRRKKY